MKMTSRLHLIRTLITQNSDTVKGVMSGYLGGREDFYSGINANIDPMSFMSRIDPGGLYLRRALDLDFSDITRYDFLSGDRDLPPNYVAEAEVSEFLGRLVCAMNAAKVIELGCYVGVSSAYIAGALRALGGERSLYCVDVEKRYLDFTAHNLGSLSLFENVHILLGNSLDPETAERLPDDADVVYIDSSHEYDQTCREILMYSRKIRPSGCVVLHDSIQWPGVRRAVQETGENFDLMTFATRRGNGVTVMMRRGDSGKSW